jgi:PDZ domain-containing protein
VALLALLASAAAAPTHGRVLIGGSAHRLGMPSEPNAAPSIYLVMAARVRPLTMAEFLLGRSDERAATQPATTERAATSGDGSMASAKNDAWAAALDSVRHPFVIASVTPGSPAERAGVLAGDLLAGTGDDLADIERLTRDLAKGHSVRLRLLRNGVPVDTVLHPEPGDTDLAAGMILSATPAEMTPPALDTGKVKGASAGLLLALADVDLLTAGSLGGGLVIAATGEVGPGGVVYGVAGYRQKIEAAVKAGAEVLLVSAADADAVRAQSPASLRVIGVQTVTQAVWELCGLGGTSAMCGNLTD